MSMYTKNAEFKAGVVVLLAILGFLAFLYFAGGSESPWRDYRYVQLRFQPGFLAPRPGDPVQMNGVTVGRVHHVKQREEVRRNEQLTVADRRKLGLRADEPGEVREMYVLATVKMPADQVIPQGSAALIDQNIAGVRQLSLLPGASTENLTDEQTASSPLPASEAPGIKDVTTNLNELVGKLDTLVVSADEVLVEARDLIATVQEKVDALDTATVNDEVKVIAKAVREAIESLKARLERIGANIEEASVDAKAMTKSGVETVDAIRDGLDKNLASLEGVITRLDKIIAKAEPQVDSFLVSMNNMSRDMESAAKNFKSLSTEFAGIGPDARRILNDLGVEFDDVVNTLGDMARNLLDASEDLRARPWLLTNKPDPGEIAFDNLRAASRNYMKAMAGAQRAMVKLSQLLARPDVHDPRVRAMIHAAMQNYQASLEKYRRDEARWTRLFETAPKGEGARVPPRNPARSAHPGNANPGNGQPGR